MPLPLICCRVTSENVGFRSLVADTLESVDRELARSERSAPKEGRDCRILDSMELIRRVTWARVWTESRRTVIIPKI